MTFPFPPGSYGIHDVAAFSGAKIAVAGSSPMIKWLNDHQVDPGTAYRVTTISWSADSRPWAALVHRYRLDADGHKYVPAWRQRLPFRFHKAAIRLPKWVWL